MSDRLTAIDLFCGAGGISAGLHEAGFDILWAADHNPDATATYEHNFGKPEYGVVTGDLSELDPETELDGLEPGELDLVAGGPPCPTFSTIGRSKIQSLDTKTPESDDRHHLYEDFLRFIDYLEPSAFLMENVPGMRSTTGVNGEPIVDIIRDQMEALDYTVHVEVVDAADFGVPQHRERLFFIGEREPTTEFQLEDWKSHRAPRNDSESEMKLQSNPDIELDSPQSTVTEFGVTLDESEKGNNLQPEDRKPWVTVADAILDLPPVSPDGGTPPTQAKEYTVPSLTEYQDWARDLESDTDWEEAELTNHRSRGHNLTDLTLYKILGEGVGWNIGKVDIGLQPYREDIFTDKYKKQHPRKPASTIVAHLQKDGHMFIHPREARSLTVREAARLQSFRDSFEFTAALTSNFKLVGNAVPPLLAEAVATAIREENL